MDQITLLKTKMSASNKLVLLYICSWNPLVIFNLRSQEIATNIGLTRSQVLKAMEDLTIDGYITTSKDSATRTRTTTITNKTKELIK